MIGKMNTNVLSKAAESDLNEWMRMVCGVKDNFPGLEDIVGYEKIVTKNIRRGTAICVKLGNNVVGIMLYSLTSNCISCMAVDPAFRHQGIASMMMDYVLMQMKNISVTTFRADDKRGIAPRALYKKYGFSEGELVEEFNYPHQKFYLIRT
jgi:ribosomal protein S18 acetylase RimI-like enzyme